MANSFKLKIVTPEMVFFDGEAESVIVKTRDGFEGYMAGRTPLCKLLAEDGEVRYREPGASDFKTAALKGGFVEVKDLVLIYSDLAEER